MKWRFCLFAVLACLAASPARAGVVYTFAYSGEITQLDLDEGLFGASGAVSVGDSFSGAFSYVVGVENPDQAPGDPELGQYDVLAASLDGTLLPLDPSIFGAVVRHESPQPTVPPAPPDDGLDAFSIPVGLNIGAYAIISISFSAPFNTALTDDSLPTSFNLADWTIAEIVGRESPSLPTGPNGSPPMADLGVITSLELISLTPVSDVPLPPAAVLFIVGVAGLCRRPLCRITSPAVE